MWVEDTSRGPSRSGRGDGERGQFALIEKRNQLNVTITEERAKGARKNEQQQEGGNKREGTSSDTGESSAPCAGFPSVQGCRPGSVPAGDRPGRRSDSSCRQRPLRERKIYKKRKEKKERSEFLLVFEASNARESLSSLSTRFP